MKRILVPLAAGLVAASALAQQGLTLRYYANQHSTALVDPLSNLLALTPTSTTTFTGAINFGDPSASLGTQAEYYTVLWTGWFVAPTAGTYTFQTGSDDGSLVYLDLDGDGVFETGNSPSERIVNNNFYQGVNYRDGTVTLAAQAYRIAIPFYQGGGGEGMYANYKLPGDSSYRTVNTADGRFFVNLYPFDVATAAATSVGQAAATLNGVMSIFSEGDFDVWAVWSTNDWGEAFATWQTKGDVESIGAQAAGGFAHPVTGLASNTTYYYRFFATNDAYNVWSDTAATFKTLGALPVVDNASGATGIGGVRAFLNGRLTGGARAYCRIYVGTTDGVWTQSYDFGSQLEGAFSVNASGLALSTTYYYRTFASNDYGVAWAPSSATFTTASTSAETLIWRGASGNNWNDATKWLPEYGVYPHALDTAVYTNIGSGTCNLNGDQAVRGIVFAPNAAGFTISGSTLSLGDRGITVVNGAAGNPTINSGLALTANATVLNQTGWPNGRDLVLGGTTDSGAYALTLDGSAANSSYANGRLTGTSVRVMPGRGSQDQGTWFLRNGNNDFTGPFIADGNTRIDSSGAVTAALDIRTTAGLLRLGWTDADKPDDGASTFGRLPNAATVAVERGLLALVGKDNTATVERIGTLRLDDGHAAIQVNAGGGTGTATLLPGSFVRANGGTATVASWNIDYCNEQNYNTGAGSNVQFGDGGASLVQIGGANTRGTDKAIAPCLVSVASANYNGRPSTFLRYDPTSGLTPLDRATDFVLATAVAFPEVNADGNDNVRLPWSVVHATETPDPAVLTLAGNTSINSLFFDSDKSSGNRTVTLTAPAGTVLTVKSGLVLASPSGAVNAISVTLSVPTLDFGSAEGFLMGWGDWSAFTISSALVGSHGLSVVHGGGANENVTLSGDNRQLTGLIAINAGNVYLQHRYALGNNSNALFVASGAKALPWVNDHLTVASASGFGTIEAAWNADGKRINIGGNGSGTETQTLKLLDSGVVRPGMAGRPGTFTFGGFKYVKLQGGTLEIDLCGLGDYDRLALYKSGNGDSESTLTLSGTSLMPVLAFEPAVGDTFLILTVGSATAISGKFAEQDSVQAVYGNRKVTFDILYNSSLAGGTGNDIVLRVSNIRPTNAGMVLLFR
jgi:hypothetical protein